MRTFAIQPNLFDERVDILADNGLEATIVKKNMRPGEALRWKERAQEREDGRAVLERLIVEKEISDYRDWLKSERKKNGRKKWK